MDALFDIDRLSLSAVARALEVHVATVSRWCLRGVRGKKLRTVLIGGRRFVLLEDLHDFVCAGNSSPLPRNQKHPQPAGGEVKVTASGKKLRRKIGRRGAP